MTPATAPRVLVVQHEDRVPLGRLRAIAGLELDVVRPDRGEPLPADAAAYDGLVVLGGTMAAWDDDVAPWLPATRALLAAAVVDGTPTLGICLGAQLLAMATGGRVEPGPIGPELGVVEISVTGEGATDRLTGALADVFLAPQGHHDAVTALPDGAVLLATSRAYPYQAFRVGECAWGVQYHPEADAATFDDWMRADADHLLAAGTSREQVMADFDAAEPALAASAVTHAVSFADVVRDRVGQPFR